MYVCTYVCMYQGCRSKNECGMARFYGQLLESFVNRSGDWYNYCKQLVLKATHAWGSVSWPPNKILNFSSSEMAF